MTAAWYYQLFGEVFGPVTWDSMVELATSGQLGQSDLVRDGEQAAGWQPADQVAGLFAAETASAESDLDQMLASNTDFVMNWRKQMARVYVRRALTELL